MAQKSDPPLHSVRINFNGTKRYRDFPFLPRIGDRINLTDKQDGDESYTLTVESVWFDDHYGEDAVEVNLNCRMSED